VVEGDRAAGLVAGRVGHELAELGGLVRVGEAPSPAGPGLGVEQVDRGAGCLVDDPGVPGAGQELVDRGHRAQHGGAVGRGDEGGEVDALDELLEGEGGARGGGADEDRVLDEGRAFPVEHGQGPVFWEGRGPVAQVVAQDEPAHRVGDDVDPVACVGVGLRGEGGEDELVQGGGLLGDVAAPVVGELEAGVVQALVVDHAGLAQRLVAVVARGEGLEDVDVGPELDPAQQAHIEREGVEDGGGHDIVADLGEGGADLHGQGDEAGALRGVGVRGAVGERAPDGGPGVGGLELGAQDARDDEHGVAVGADVLGGLVVDRVQVRPARGGLAGGEGEQQQGGKACRGEPGHRGLLGARGSGVGSAYRRGRVRTIARIGAVTQLVECQLCKLEVGSSSLLRSIPLAPTAFIWEACVHLGIDDRRLFVFDTFDGFPPGETDAFRGRTFGPEDFIPDGTNFRAAFDEYTRDVIPADRVRVVPGMVEQTLPPIEFGELAFVRLDTDFYASTRAELETLYPRLVAGGVLIIDDYGSFDGARRATDEYFEANRPAPALLRIDHGTHCGIKVHAGSR
jgi:hypothetical protein